MEWIPLSSSNLHAARHDPRTGTMDVEFRDGAVYRYSGVPERVFQGLLQSTSPGEYLDRFVKKAGYPCQQIR